MAGRNTNSRNLNFKPILNSYTKSTTCNIVQPTNLLLANLAKSKFKINLPPETRHKIYAYLGAHICTSSTSHVKFDSDSFEAVLDSGCSTTLTCDRSDFITYTDTTGEVEGLGTHNIVGTGSVKYKILDDNGNIKSLIIHDAIHVPTLKIRLISIQQVAQQSTDPLAGGHVLAQHLHLRWDNNIKTITYNSNSNLPILCTAPNGKIAAAYITQHLHKFAYKNAKSRSVQWDKALIQPGESNISPEFIDKEEFDPIKEIKSSLKTPRCHKTPKHQISSLSFCNGCDKPTLSSAEKHDVDQCKQCCNLGGLSPEGKLLLHYHNMLDHMGFGALRDLAKQGYLPRKIAKAEEVICAACQIGKGIKRASDKGSVVL